MICDKQHLFLKFAAFRFEGACVAFLCLSATMTAQVSLNVNSNLEQTAGTTSTHHSTVVGSNLAHPYDFEKLRLEFGDTLQMSVFGAPEMDRTLQVDDLGDIVVPLAGTIRVAGDTLRQVETKVGQALIEKNMFNAPQVSLELIGFTPHGITVSGEVQSPGALELLVPRNLLDVLALAGGETPAAGGEIVIHQHVAGAEDSVRRIQYSSKANDAGIATATLVYPGDTVEVTRAGVVYVIGAVSRPGGYLMVNSGSLSVPEAIAVANGETVIASTRTAIVVRRDKGAVSRFEVQLNDEQKGLRPPTQLRDGDILYVLTSKLKATLVNTSSIIASAASAGIIAASGR